MENTDTVSIQIYAVLYITVNYEMQNNVTIMEFWASYLEAKFVGFSLRRRQTMRWCAHTDILSVALDCWRKALHHPNIRNASK